MTKIRLIGAGLDTGQQVAGCLMGPTAFRVAGIGATLADLGHQVQDQGDLAMVDVAPLTCSNATVHHYNETRAWTQALAKATYSALTQGLMPIIMGGDHSLTLGTGFGAARHAKGLGRPLFLLWLDAHSDFHTLKSTRSGNLHGTPVAYLAGCGDFDGFDPFPSPIPAQNICLFGIRSVDPEENLALFHHDIAINDMRVLDERGIVAPLREFLAKVQSENGLLHVSLDVDFLDPSFAPAVGTTVLGGATLREAHLVMELLHESGLMTSLDLVELNPFLDEKGKTALIMVDLVASLMGRRVFDRPTRSA
jgi:arginase